MIKFGNFEFIFAIKGPQSGTISEEIQKNEAQNTKKFLTITLGWSMQ